MILSAHNSHLNMEDGSKKIDWEELSEDNKDFFKNPHVHPTTRVQCKVDGSSDAEKGIAIISSLSADGARKALNELNIATGQLDKYKKPYPTALVDNMRRALSAKIKVIEGLIIIMPENKRTRMEQELKKYEERLKRYQNEKSLDPRGIFGAFEGDMVGNIPRRCIGTIYKITLVKELLEKGRVNPFELSKKLKKEHQGFDDSRFQKACSVILGYCEGRYSF